MIFVIYSLTWIFTATTFTMLVIPVILVMVRASYLDRNVFLIWIPVMSSTLIFLYLYHISQKQFLDAALDSGKVLSSSFLFIHLAVALRKDGPSYAGSRLGTLLLLIQRCMVLEKRMILNSLYSFRVRLRFLKSSSKKLSLAGLWSSFLGIILTITLELLRLADEIKRLYQSRGSNPVSKGWVIPKTRKVPIIIGDAMIVIILSLLMGFDLSELVPRFMINLLDRLN